jgi:hypothetical protein
MNVTFTLTSATSGTTVAGPFNISGTTSGNTTTELATGITKAQLTTGHTINGVNDAITGGTIASTGTTCPSSTTTWSVIQPTPTPTPTATPVPTYYVYELCGWSDSSERYKYILYSDTYGSKGLVNGTTCSLLDSGPTAITYASVGTLYPLAMPMSSFTTNNCECV